MAFDATDLKPATPLEKKRRIAHTAEAYLARAAEVFRGIPNIEGIEPETFRALPIDMNGILGPAARAAISDGAAVSAIGDLMDYHDFDHDEMHGIACSCHGDEVNGYYLGTSRFGLYADLVEI